MKTTNLRFFKEARNKAQAKSIYRNLCKTHHPDKGGDVQTMQAINAEYDQVLKYLPDNDSNTGAQKNAETPPPKRDPKREAYEKRKAKDDEFFKQKSGVNDYKSKIFPNALGFVICIAIGQSSTRLNLETADKYVMYLKKTGAFVTLYEHHFEYSHPKTKKK